MNKVLILLISLALLCGSCVTSKNYMNRDKLMALKLGMNKQQVTKLYGNPHYRNIERGYEIWKYKYLELWGGYSFIEIKFVGEFAESIDSYFLPDNYPVPANKSSSENLTTQ